MKAKLRAKSEVLGELMEEHVAPRRVLGRSEGPGDAARHPRPGGGLGPALEPEDRALHAPLHRLAGPATSKFYDRQARYGQVNEHNGWVPRDFWPEEWEIRPSMTTAEVETILQRAGEKFPGASPRVVSDNGPQFIARDFAERDRQLEEARQQTCQRA